MAVISTIHTTHSIASVLCYDRIASVLCYDRGEVPIWADHVRNKESGIEKLNVFEICLDNGEMGFYSSFVERVQKRITLNRS